MSYSSNSKEIIDDEEDEYDEGLEISLNDLE